MTLPTLGRVRELLAYDATTGLFCWRVARTNVKAGQRTGSKGSNGYLHIRVDKKLYLAHRLAWLYAHGELPDGAQIDHINSQRDDNRLANLRLASNAENQQNRKRAQSSSSTGVLGVTVDGRRRKRFLAMIKINGKSKSLGRFSTADEAGAAYLDAKRQMHPFSTI